MIHKRGLKIYATLTAFFIVLLSLNVAISQPLPRKAFLGARLMELSAVEEELGADNGLYLSEILPSGTLGTMNVPVGGILQQINGEPIGSLSDLSPGLANLYAGDKINVQIWLDGTVKKYSGIAIGKPKEKHPQATVAYGEVKYTGNTLRSLLYLPKGIEKPPVVFFLQGYTCQSIEMRNDHPAKQLIDSWITNGYAVFLVEKPGMGDSDSQTPCLDIDFDQELIAFSKAYESLRSNPQVDAANIFLFGHSMGGIIAPLLAKEHRPAGVMVFGIVSKNWYDYMVDIYTEQPLIFGNDAEQVKADNKYNLPFIEDLLVHKKPKEELINHPLYGDFLKENGTAESLAQGYFIYRHYTYWQRLADVDVPAAWSQVKSPVFVLHGAYDIQAIHPKYGEMIVDNVNEHGGTASFELFPKTEHAFLQFESREAQLTTLSNGTYASKFTTHFNAAIADESWQWMENQRNNK